ncbi:MULTISPECIES: DUF3800 domain-containing protein [unclassified Mammaliicoccus]|uniref:DUF3800 domain-containing protein n=1 Tax=unclassified Mammaliicoccus TaxID=2803851 RepID=UPI001EFAABB8|nr:MULTISPECIES: DUF3800 domain-containing protein [unclassified Mammaliicoccus]
MINMYCDESCHLENDKINTMILGALTVPEFAKESVYEHIKLLKKDMNISKHREIKWTKVSMGEIDYYKRLIDFFFDNELLTFRAVVLPDKSLLNHDAFERTHDDFYYIMYYYLIRKYMNTKESISVYIDIKDTQSSEKVRKLHQILGYYGRKNNSKEIKKIQHIRSHENSILQLADLLIGAVGYKNRGLKTSKGKLELVNYIERKFQTSLSRTSQFSEEKLNIFILDSIKEV